MGRIDCHFSKSDEAKLAFFSGIFMNPEFSTFWFQGWLMEAAIISGNINASKIDRMHANACAHNLTVLDLFATLNLKSLMQSPLDKAILAG